MRGILTKLLMVALLTLVAWNTSQISALRREIAGLQERTAGVTERGGRQVLLEKAWEHARKAKSYALKGDLKHAEIEWDAAHKLMKQAGQEATAPTISAVERLQRNLKDTGESMERLRKQLDGK